MSTQNRPLIVGLAAPGLLWLATSVAPAQDTPTAPPGPPTPAPTSPSKTYRALLLSNGKVVQGEIVEDAAAGVFRLRGRVGTVPYPRSMVLKAGGSVEELYRFQAVRLPAGDPDERMKLARWCLTEHLTAQAREQLLAIQQMSPGDVEVERMLYNLASATARTPVDVDVDVRRSSGEMPRGDAPATLDPRVLKNALGRFNALPEIFDLPQAQAVKRANEFADYVQPVLMASCVRCHNEKYRGEFQLVETKGRRDQGNSDIARANLDATLRLINPDDPSQSKLLSAGLVPHDGSKNAIFKGPNDRNYQVLSTWTKSLKPARAGNNGDGASRTGFSSPDNVAGDGFATERTGRPASQAAAAPTSRGPVPRAGSPRLPAGDPAFGGGVPMMPAPTPRMMLQSYERDAEFVNSPGDAPEFPTPFSVGGKSTPRPIPPSPRPPAGLPALPGDPDAPGAATPNPSVVPRTATQVGPGAVVVGPTDDPNELPGMNQPHYPPKAEADPARKPAKKIDNALLEKMMKNRNGTGTP